jgi:pimeloyl-ACP methyl ester carboxylesterase
VNRRIGFTLRDGRRLVGIEEGDPGGTLLVFHHGSPGAAIPFAPFDAAAAERGIRFVTFSRPGYGGSSRREGRLVADVAADAAALADHLGADRFLTAGWSGGGPHALACAALLPERVLACATIASVAPWDAEGLDWTAGMGETNQLEYPQAANDPVEHLRWMESNRDWLASADPDVVLEEIGSVISPIDASAMTGELGEMIAASFREAARTGILGWYDDDLAYTRPWGFELSQVQVPVAIWQGGQDLMVPFAHGRWLADHVAGAEAHLYPEHGHLSIAVGSLGRILDALLGATGID